MLHRKISNNTTSIYPFTGNIGLYTLDRFIAVDTSVMKELGFSSTRLLTVSMFSSIIFVRGGLGSFKGETSLESINLLITLEKA